jgi:hypothetical protein
MEDQFDCAGKRAGHRPFEACGKGLERGGFGADQIGRTE